MLASLGLPGPAQVSNHLAIEQQLSICRQLFEWFWVYSDLLMLEVEGSDCCNVTQTKSILKQTISDHDHMLRM